jgi:pimeloyl-ACP methyl ester carboxylesterase
LAPRACGILRPHREERHGDRARQKSAGRLRPSSPQCWSPLLDLLRGDTTFATFAFECYEYSTSWLEFNILKRIPRLEEVSLGLAKFLEASRFDAYRDITLVGHSLGGLVVQSYLAERLKAGKGEDLARIRQVILLAAPNLGSTRFCPKDYATCDECDKRIWDDPLPCVHTDASGIWEWELTDIREGIIDVRWEFAGAATPAGATVDPSA